MSNHPSKIRPIPLTAILAFFTCTFFFYRDFGYRMIYGYAALGLCLGAQVLLQLRRRERPAIAKDSAAVLALAAVIALHFLRPDARRDADTLSYLISMLICMAYVVAADGTGRQLRLASRIMYGGAMAMATFVAVCSLAPQLFLKAVYPILSQVARNYYDFFAPLGYGVSLGTYSYTNYVLYLGVAVCCADLLCSERTAKRVAGNLCSLLWLGLAMVVLGRRGELLATAAALAVLVLLLCSPKNRRRLLLWGTLGGAAALGLVVLFLPQLKAIPVLTRYVQTLEQLLAGVDFTSGRGPLLLEGWRGFLTAPVFGMGWGRYIDRSALIGMCDTEGNLIEDCHNIYLQFLCETGIVGMVLLLIPIFWLLYRTCRRLMVAKKAGDLAALRFASISFLIQFFLLFLGLYDPSFQKIVFWCFYALGLIFGKAAEGGTS